MNGGQRNALILGVGVTVASIAAAYWARYSLVEVDGLEAFCAQQAQQLRCTLRLAVITAFQEHRLGGAAILFAALALCTRRGAWALMALAVAGPGLVLYDADVSAVAWLASAWALQRAASRPAGPAPN
jgi:hypothetical protein